MYTQCGSIGNRGRRNMVTLEALLKIPQDYPLYHELPRMLLDMGGGVYHLSPALVLVTYLIFNCCLWYV